MTRVVKFPLEDGGSVLFRVSLSWKGPGPGAS
jgi:hypothetical protein